MRAVICFPLRPCMAELISKQRCVAIRVRYHIFCNCGPQNMQTFEIWKDLLPLLLPSELSQRPAKLRELCLCFCFCFYFCWDLNSPHVNVTAPSVRSVARTTSVFVSLLARKRRIGIAVRRSAHAGSTTRHVVIS
ncbi:hypothetical protein BD309DRAFT_950043 [Dichomitus squalens]|nr:hypothetical protein BD309DRAFT_950043 [Dichomitus squalens]